MTNKIEVSKEIIHELFKIAKIDIPTEITEEELLNLVFKLKMGNSTSNSEDISFNPTSNNILVVDDIGVVTYQLRVLLTNLGYNVQVAKDIFSGLNMFIRTNFAFLIMDLFVSTEQEGYTLLNETKKIITKNNLNTKIIIITASNKSEHKIKCLNSGADIFIKKETGWQDLLAEKIESYMQQLSLPNNEE